MPSNFFDSLTSFIIEPGKQAVAGGVLAGIVWKFFERVESVLKDETKKEIAFWLVGVKVGQKVEPWPRTFARVLDRVFGTKHLSWKCFWRSCVLSCVTLLVGTIIFGGYAFNRTYFSFRFYALIVAEIVPQALGANILPDYLSLLKTRLLIGRITRMAWQYFIGLLVLDIFTSFCMFSAWIATVEKVVLYIYPHQLIQSVFGEIAGFEEPLLMLIASKASKDGRVYLVPLFATSIWLWLYAGSGFVLKAARRFDIGFQWLNRKFDIEKN